MRPLAISAILASLALIAAVLFLSSHPDAKAQATTNVSIGDFFFCDVSFQNGVCETTINQGDTVIWTNNGSTAHTVQECNDTFTVCPPPAGFDSGLGSPLSTGQTFSHTFSVAGNFEYRCQIHPPQMRGRVNVLAAQQTPSPTAAPTGTTQAPTGAPTAAPTGASPAASPSPSRVPAAAPQTGGTPSGDGAGFVLIVAAIGGAIAVVSAATAVNLLRRR